MLTFEQVKQNYDPKIFQKNPKAALVEYLQHEVLDSIFKQAGSENLSFMGGTAIRIIYGSKRFSEDLDFDNFGLSYKEFENLLTKTANDMKSKGFDMEFHFVEKGAYHCHIKFLNMLFDNKLSLHKGEKILIRIDTVHKKKITNPNIFTLNAFGVYRKIQVNPLSVVLPQKMIALIQRKREKGRDIYDVSYLLGMTDIDENFLEKEYGLKIAELKSKMAEHLKLAHLDSARSLF